MRKNGRLVLVLVDVETAEQHLQLAPYRARQLRQYDQYQARRLNATSLKIAERLDDDWR